MTLFAPGEGFWWNRHTGLPKPVFILEKKEICAEQRTGEVVRSILRNNFN